MEARIKLEALIAEANKQGINFNEIPAVKRREKLMRLNCKIKFALAFAVFGIVFYQANELFGGKKCLLAMPSDFDKIFRKPDDCSFCEGISSGIRISNLNSDEFEEKYAYSGQVVVVTDATKNWTAIDVFDFWFFKKVYEQGDPKLKTLGCQFFRYQTKFKNLFDALKMSKARVEYKSGTEPWYFGWSNCNEEIAGTLRKHYNRPYFLPRTSELNAIDWIFMGGKGLGAHMHLDNVRLPSWQAQLKGTKEWLLAPPPECIFICSFFSMVVKPGDIIVLNTNKWFHKTNVLSDEISITVGAEYD